MAIKLNKILTGILKDQKIDKLEETKKTIIETLGEKFFNRLINNMYFENKKIIIETKHIEAKTELNLIKKNLNIVTRLS